LQPRLAIDELDPKYTDAIANYTGLKQTRFGVNHPIVMSPINKLPVDPLHIASEAPVQGPRKKVPGESKTTNRMKDQAKLSKTMKTQSEPSRRD
jgi:hypothetical protein